MRKLDIVKNLQSSTDLNRKEASEFFETFLNQLKIKIKRLLDLELFINILLNQE